MAASEDPRHAGEAGPGAGSSSGSHSSSGPSDDEFDEQQAGSRSSDGPDEERLKSSSPSPGPASSTASGSPGADSPGAPGDAASSSGEADGLAHEGAEDSSASEVEDPLALVSRERDELRETVQRVQADFENFRKRMMRDQAVSVDRATAGLVEQVLPVLDSFELAVLNIPEHDLDDAARKLKKGVELVYAELLGVLEKNGLERLDAQGKPFDPEEHEAVMREGQGEGEPVVTEVMRTGYRLKGRVLRPAMVKVGPAGASG